MSVLFFNSEVCERSPLWHPAQEVPTHFRRSGQARGRPDPPPSKGRGKVFPVSYGPLTRCASVAVSRVERGAVFPRSGRKKGDGCCLALALWSYFGVLRPSVVSLVPLAHQAYSTRAHQADGAYPPPAGTFPRVIAVEVLCPWGFGLSPLGRPPGRCLPRWVCAASTAKGRTCGGLFFPACRLPSYEGPRSRLRWVLSLRSALWGSIGSPTDLRVKVSPPLRSEAPQP